MLRDQDVILIASAPWRIDGKVNCHHIAERLAWHNRVLYVESPGLRMPNVLHGPDRRKLLQRGRNWIRNLTSGPQRVGERLFIISPPVLPVHRGAAANRLNRLTFGTAIRRCAHQLGFRRPVLWVFLPTGVYATDALPDAPVVYHCTDDYAGNAGVSPKVVDRLEQRLLKRADLVFATSRPLAERLAKMHPRVMCMPNVAEVERFLQPRPVPRDLATLPRPIIGYVGNLAGYMVDTQLLRAVADARPAWSFALIGPHGAGDPTTDLSALASSPNVFMLGPRPYDDVPAYINTFDACMIPFALTRVTHSALPLKSFEYLAAGKPVVSTPLKSILQEHLENTIAFAAGTQEFIKQLDSGIAQDSHNHRAHRRAVAGRYCWTTRFPQIEAAVSSMLRSSETAAPAGARTLVATASPM